MPPEVILEFQGCKVISLKTFLQDTHADERFGTRELAVNSQHRQVYS